jgi:hypothetical protein
VAGGGMVKKKSSISQSEELKGLKYLQRVRGFLKRLEKSGCQRDRAENRKLHFDEYCMLVLLFIFNPALKSVRGLQQASELKKVQKKLGISRVSTGSFSEAANVFDADELLEIIRELKDQLQPVGRDALLADIAHTITLVDGSLLTALPRMMEASQLLYTKGKGTVRWRLHTHFELENWVPTRIDVTRDGGGECDERYVLELSLEPKRCYITDKGFAKFHLFNRIHTIGSTYVCRIRDNAVYEVVSTNELSQEAIEADVIEDVIVHLGSPETRHARPDHPTRLITIRATPHDKRRSGGKTGPGCDGYIRLATNMLDVPAEIIALLYRYRWTIEIFFRFFKQVMGCRHLLSCHQNGIEIQTYCAIIACMLISLWTGNKPNIRTYEMICHYFTGLASEKEFIAHLKKRNAPKKTKGGN